MDDKYFKLQDIVIDTFDLDAPIEIEKGVLFLDKSSRDVLLQLKLNILGIDISRLSSVSFLIECMDDASEIIANISPYTYTYRDIFLNKSRSFGEDSPILLDRRVRRVKVGIQRVVFTDSTTWIPAENRFTPQKQELITSLQPELVEQFQRDIRHLSPAVKENYRYIPWQLDNYWLCPCGRPNKNDIDDCVRCGLSKKTVFLVSEDALQIKLDEYNEQIRQEQEIARIASEQARLQALEKAQKEEESKARLREEEKVRLKRKRFTLLVASLVVVFIIVYISVTVPAKKYSQASSFLSNKDYENASSVLESLGTYKDSYELLKESNYQLGLSILNDGGSYDTAVSIFTSLGDYKDSYELLKESNYQLGLSILNDSGSYDTAVSIFTSLVDYKDSAELLNESNYQLAVSLLNDGYDYRIYDKVASILTSLFRYKDSADLLIELNYQKALDSYEGGYYYTAQSIFREIPNYKDSDYYLKNIEKFFDDSSSSSSSSSSSTCDTLWSNLDAALLLSGGETTDLTVYYTKALMDNDCFD